MMKTKTAIANSHPQMEDRKNANKIITASITSKINITIYRPSLFSVQPLYILKMDIFLTHVTLHFNVLANQLPFAVSSSNRWFRVSTGLRQA